MVTPLSHSLSSPSISSLLAMVESFLHQSPPRVQEAVRCLLAVLTLRPPPRTEAKTRLQLGLVLYHHTNNLLEAREHLDKAVGHRDVYHQFISYGYLWLTQQIISQHLGMHDL